MRESIKNNELDNSKTIQIIDQSVTELDSIGIESLSNQISLDSDGLVIISDDKSEKWTAGDFLELVAFYDASAKKAADNMTRLLLAAYDRGLYDEVKSRFLHRFRKQTTNQWKTQIEIASILRANGLPIRCIEAIRSDFGLKLLKKYVKIENSKLEIASALIPGSAASKLQLLKQKYTGKMTVLEDYVYSQHTPDRQFEEFIFKLFEKEKPDFVWRHLGKDKKSEMGIDILGEKTGSDRKWRIGIQVKLYQPHSYISEDDWRDFLAGCTIHKVNEIHLVIRGRLTQKQLQQVQMADISVWELDQLNRLADKHSIPHFE